MTTIKDHSVHMARYGAWAYERLFASLATVSDADYRADSGLFFHSLHGTLNHLLLADCVWFSRFTGQSFKASSLAQVVEADRAMLIARVRAQAERWIGFVESADPGLCDARLAYRSMAGDACDTPWVGTLLHVFNHGTHHRGQMSAALTRFGQPTPEMDFVYFLRMQGV